MPFTVVCRDIRIPKGAKIGPDQEPIYGWLVLPAYCAGGLAVHKVPDSRKALWRVSHEPSGLSLGVLDARTRKQAMANMQAALALNFDWTKSEKETLADMRVACGLVDGLHAIARAAEAP